MKLGIADGGHTGLQVGHKPHRSSAGAEAPNWAYFLRKEIGCRGGMICAQTWPGVGWSLNMDGTQERWEVWRNGTP